MQLMIRKQNASSNKKMRNKALSYDQKQKWPRVKTYWKLVWSKDSWLEIRIFKKN